MNRHQRRATGKGQGAGTDSRVPAVAPAAPVEQALQAAFQALMAGRVADAETVARRVLAANPRHGGALHLLGLVANAVGRHEDAARLIGQAAALNPKDAEARNSLGSILLAMGRTEAALAAFDQAIAIRPQFPEALANLGQALRRLGRLDEAIAACRRASALLPGLVEAQKSLGLAYGDQGRFAEAAEALDRAAALRPDDAETLYNLAVALHRAGLGERAEVAARRAIAAAPADPDTHGVLAQALMQLGRPDDAVAAMDAALALDTGRAATLALRGSMMAELGGKAEAIRDFEAALALDPESAPALAGLVDLIAEEARAPLMERMAQVLATRPGLTVDDRLKLNFALGKEALRHKDGDRAFAYLGEGNRLKRARIRFDIAAQENAIQAIAEAFTPSRMADLTGAGAPSDRPVFVIGMPRSGTTLIEQILASHPQVWGAGELNTFAQLVGAMPPPGYPSILETIAPDALATLGRAYLDATDPLGPGRRRLVDKMPSNFLYAGLIALALPQARIVHCRRNAVDTCLSCYSLLFDAGQEFAYDLGELGRYWRAYDRLMAHWRGILPPQRFLEVEYEDVTADLETQARRLIDFVGLDWDPACLAFHKTERAVRTASLNQVRQPIYRSSVGRAQAFAAHLGPLLAALSQDASEASR